MSISIYKRRGEVRLFEIIIHCIIAHCMSKTDIVCFFCNKTKLLNVYKSITSKQAA